MTLTWLWPFPMLKRLFLCMGDHKYTLKNCTRWFGITLTWIWHSLVSKMLFLGMISQKYNFWKIALDDSALLWPQFDVPWCLWCFFCAWEVKIHFKKLHLMTSSDPAPPHPTHRFQISQNKFTYCHDNQLKSPEILRYRMIFDCRLTLLPAAAPALPYSRVLIHSKIEVKVNLCKISESH